jgi:hypothetical protein
VEHNLHAVKHGRDRLRVTHVELVEFDLSGDTGEILFLPRRQVIDHNDALDAFPQQSAH